MPRAPRFDEECAFWSALTGWELRSGSRPEFAFLDRQPGMPLRILLQRLGTDRPGGTDGTARAHLDVACGGRVAAIVELHRVLGASVVHEGPRWITMRDPAGWPYCLTERDPQTGALLSPAGDPPCAV